MLLRAIRGHGASRCHTPGHWPRRGNGFTTPYLASGSRCFSSGDADRDSREGPSHWRAFGYRYMLSRGWGIASRVWGCWSEFIDYYEQGVFARSSTDEARSRMFVLTCMPRATTVDLFEFMTGATHAARMVYHELYADGAHYPNVSVDKLEGVTVNSAALSVLTRKPRRQAQQLAVHGEPRKTKLVLEQLDLSHVGLASVDYHMQRLSDDEAEQRGYQEEEWLRLEVAYDVVEHIRVCSADSTTASIDDHKTFETSFTWVFETKVSDPSLLDWKIVEATDFAETSAVVQRTTKSPLG